MDLRACIHCGLCLNACPTYRATGDEAESPRGRLVVMEALAGGDVTLGRGPIDRCLGCRNCETVCPSGVAYGDLLESAREQLGPRIDGPARWVRPLVQHVMRHPRRLAWLARAGWMRRWAHWFPATLREPLEALPDRPAASLPSRRVGGHPAALLTGCAQAVFCPDVARSTMELAEHVQEPLDVPAPDVCCGALSHHLGEIDAAKEAVLRCAEAFAAYQEVVVPSAGCSAHLRAVGHLFGEGEPGHERAVALAAKTVDVLPWLTQRADRLRPTSRPARVVYHPPCHHTHAQGIQSDAVQLLARVPDLEVLPLRDADRCCGSAGTYNLLEPALAAAARSEKLDHVLEVGPEIVLSANPGCELYIEKGLRGRGLTTPVRHLVEFLADCCR